MSLIHSSDNGLDALMSLTSGTKISIGENVILDEETHKYSAKIYFGKYIDYKVTNVLEEKILNTDKNPIALSGTTIMKWADDKYNFDKKRIPKAILEKASADGTKIHKKIENMEYSKIEKWMAENFFMSHSGIRELTFWNTKYNVVGMIDLLYIEETDDKLIIKLIDHKVSASDKKDYLTKQLSVYLLCLTELFKALKEEVGKPIQMELIGHQIFKKTGKEKRIDIKYMGKQKTEEFIKKGWEAYKLGENI